jgi:hypothetical protein
MSDLTDLQAVFGLTKPNDKMIRHGFLMIHGATIKPTPGAAQPLVLEVTGTWKPYYAPKSVEPKMTTKAVAAGSRQPLERYARENNLPINQP